MAHLIQTVDLNQVEKTLFKHMNDLRMENLFCDVRFNVNSTIMPCHRVVLSAISPYFRTMFNGNFKESNSDTVTMNDIETETFEEILNAIYTASIRFHPGNAYFLLKSSHLFQLEMIENACVSYIMKNPEIIFLIETCVFARNIQLDELYLKCSQTIVDNIMVHGKTNSFKKIPLDVFEKILNSLDGYLKESDEEPVLLLIMKWSKHNNASREDIETLLRAVCLKSTKLISPSVMSQWLVCSDDIPINENYASGGIQESHDDFNLPLNLYVNAIDVETGQRGWSVLKLNSGLDKYVLSSFHPTSAMVTKVCRVGTKLYCFEVYLGDAEDVMNFYSCDEKDGTKIHLPTPQEGPDLTTYWFEMTAAETSIYLMIKSPFFSVWLYDCETNTWNNILKKNEHEKIYCNVSACTFSSGSFYIIAQKEKSSMHCLGSTNYIFSITPTLSTSVVKELTTVPLHRIRIDNLYFSVSDGKIALSTVYWLEFFDKKNSFMIFDLANCQWSSDLKEMKSRHVNFHQFHYNGSVYFVENGRPLIHNEKYDLSSGKWIDLPCLPKRITIPNTSQVLATGEVFGADVNL